MLDVELESFASSLGQLSAFAFEPERDESADWLCDALGVAVELDCAHALPTPRPPTTSALAVNTPATMQ